MKKDSIKIYFPVLILLIFLVAACEEQTIDPIEESSGIYSIYGTIEIGESPNVVRIRNLKEPFLADSGSFDGTVTFENMATGNISTLQDSVVDFSGNQTHNFIIEDEIEFNQSYLIRAERTDGLKSSSIATTPLPPDISFTPEEDILCDTPIQFVFGNVVRPERISFEINVLYDGQSVSSELALFLGELVYDEENNEVSITMSPNDLLVEVFPPVLPDVPNFDPYRLSPTVGCSQLDSNNFQLTYIHFGPEWTNGKKQQQGSIDPESGDVENGLGFFGAFNRETFNFSLTN